MDNPILTRVGIFEYQNPDGTIRRELRLPEEVFAPESLASYKGKPVILTHEAGMIDTENVQQEHIGTILSEGIQDGENVRAQIVIHDAHSLSYGLRELSVGYSLDLEETPGEWKGQPYDAIQRNIRVNHLALVEKARAGDSARLNIDGKDTQQNQKGGNTMSKRKDGLTPEEIARVVEEYKKRKEQRMQQSSQMVADEEGSEENPQENQDEGEGTASDPVQDVKDRRDRRDASGDCETMDEANGVIAQQDEDIQKLLDFIAQLQAKIDFDEASEENKSTENNADEEGAETPVNMDSVKLDAVESLVRQRIELIRLGDKLNMDGIETMKPMDAKKAIIKKVNPNIRLDGKDKAYIDAMFDITKENIGKRKGVEYQRQQMRGDSSDRPAHKQPEADSAAARRMKMIARMDGNENKGGNR